MVLLHGTLSMPYLHLLLSSVERIPMPSEVDQYKHKSDRSVVRNAAPEAEVPKGESRSGL
jgi:hypothetical protein